VHCVAGWCNAGESLAQVDWSGGSHCPYCTLHCTALHWYRVPAGSTSPGWRPPRSGMLVTLHALAALIEGKSARSLQNIAAWDVINRSPHRWDLLFSKIFVKSIIFECLFIFHNWAPPIPQLGARPIVEIPQLGEPNCAQLGGEPNCGIPCTALYCTALHCRWVPGHAGTKLWDGCGHKAVEE
jgi:hypothetical protein